MYFQQMGKRVMPELFVMKSKIKERMTPQRLASEHWSEGDKSNPFKKLTEAWCQYEDEWIRLDNQYEESI